MKTLTLADIREHNPCYDPATKVPENWSGTVLDILRLDNVPPGDRLWAVSWFLSDKTLRLFAVWCARQALALVPNPDPRSVAACDVAERYAHGKATDEELAAAWDAVGDAVLTSANSAAWSAAWSAASAAAWSAASAAAWSVARDAASNAAWDAAWTTARDAQIKHLVEMLEAGAR